MVCGNRGRFVNRVRMRKDRHPHNARPRTAPINLVCFCVLYGIWKHNSCSYFTKNTIKQEHAENIHKECMNLFTVFLKAINAKILEHHEANPRFWLWVSSGVAKLLARICLGRDSTYVDMESPPIMLWRCDWTLGIWIHLINPKMN